MAGVGDEPPLPSQRLAQPAQQAVHGPGQRCYLVPRGGNLDRGLWVPDRDVGDLAPHALNRAQRR